MTMIRVSNSLLKWSKQMLREWRSQKCFLNKDHSLIFRLRILIQSLNWWVHLSSRCHYNSRRCNCQTMQTRSYQYCLIFHWTVVEFTTHHSSNSQGKGIRVMGGSKRRRGLKQGMCQLVCMKDLRKKKNWINSELREFLQSLLSSIWVGSKETMELEL
jgi:hypothetical protein